MSGEDREATARRSLASLLAGRCWQDDEPLTVESSGWLTCPACQRRYFVKGEAVVERVPSIRGLAGKAVQVSKMRFVLADETITDVMEGDVTVPADATAWLFGWAPGIAWVDPVDVMP